MSNAELETLHRLNAAVLSDVLDSRGLMQQAMKPFMRPLDRARMVERDVPVQCAGVDVRPGDLVFGDVDGVVVIPREHEAAVVTRAMEKVAGENQSRDALRRGELLGDVFRRLGIL